MFLPVQLFLADVLARLNGVAKRDERGLSQSTENALLVAGAVAVATLIAGLVLAFVTRKLQVLN